MPAGKRAAQHTANMQFFLTHDAPAAHRYQPDLAALTAVAASIIPAAGELSAGSFPYQCAQALARHLNRPGRGDCGLAAVAPKTGASAGLIHYSRSR